MKTKPIDDVGAVVCNSQPDFFYDEDYNQWLAELYRSIDEFDPRLL